MVTSSPVCICSISLALSNLDLAHLGGCLQNIHVPQRLAHHLAEPASRFGYEEGRRPSSAAKAGLASRTNTLFSGPMLLGMLGSKHLALPLGGASTGLYLALGLIVILEINALFGKQGPMTSVKGVIHMSALLTLVIWALLYYM